MNQPEDISMSNANDKNILTKLFADKDSVQNAYKQVLESGHSVDDVNFVMNEATREKHFKDSEIATEIGNKSVDGLAVGGTAGGILGGVAAAVAAIGTALAIPGLGLIVSGPLLAGLAGAGAGGIAGGLIGTLIGWGIPEEKVKEYEAAVKNGGILMAVKSKDDESYQELSKHWNS
jgi:hypothetical protein